MKYRAVTCASFGSKYSVDGYMVTTITSETGDLYFVSNSFELQRRYLFIDYKPVMYYDFNTQKIHLDGTELKVEVHGCKVNVSKQEIIITNNGMQGAIQSFDFKSTISFRESVVEMDSDPILFLMYDLCLFFPQNDYDLSFFLIFLIHLICFLSECVT